MENLLTLEPIELWEGFILYILEAQHTTDYLKFRDVNAKFIFDDVPQ